MSELSLKNSIIKMMRKEFPGIWFYKSADQFHSGIPDIIGCLRSKFFAIEIKTSAGRVSRIQSYTIKSILKANGLAGVVRSVKQARELLKTIF